MKSWFKKAIINKASARFLIKPILKLHSLSYTLADLFSIALEGGIHPKHRIIKYNEWFLGHIEPGWVILDIGCNTGLVSWLLAEKATFVYGIEIQNKLIKEAELKRKKDNIEYICADATKIDFGMYKPIDCVVLSNVLEHIEDRDIFLKKVITNLKWRNPEHKRLLFRVPMINRDWIVLYKRELGLDHRSDKSHFIEYTFEEFEKELSLAGLRIVKYDIKFGEILAVSEAA